MAKLQKVVDKAALEVVEAQTAEKDEIVEDVEQHTCVTACPAWEKTCLKCGGPNHFSSQCRTTNPKVNEMVTQDSSEDEFFVDSLYIGNICTEDNSAWFSVVKVNGSKLKMKLDTGASANVISWKTFTKLQNSPRLQPSNACLRGYGDHTSLITRAKLP